MYLKTQTVKKANGKSYTYYRLAESYRENGKVKHRILAELGALAPEEVSIWHGGSPVLPASSWAMTSRSWKSRG
jgi:hypothetical protein